MVKKTADKQTTGPQVSVFRNAMNLAINANKSSFLDEFSASESLLLADAEFIDFHKPTEILVSRHYPGYRIFKLNGSEADEALGLLLAQSLNTEKALEAFRVVLSTPDIASGIITTLFPRLAVPLRRGKYLVSEAMVAKTAAARLEGSTSDVNVIAAVTHVVVRVLASMGLVLEDETQTFATTANELALGMKDIEKAVMIEALRDVFSQARINEAIKELDADATPNIVGEVIGRMLRNASHAIPEIRLRMEQLDMVQALIQTYYRNPEKLSNAMRASTTLQSLAGYANFLVDALAQKKTLITRADNSDLKEACNVILTAIRAAPSIESIPLMKYADYFGSVPVSASDGIYRGLVLYLALSQPSAISVVNMYEKPNGAELSLIPSVFTPAATMAPEISRSLLSMDAMLGLANLAADEISDSKFTIEDRPVLRTIGMDSAALTYLAIAHAETVAVTISRDAADPFNIIYATSVSEHWRTRLGASSPNIAYFADPASMLVYHSGAVSKMPTALPARAQTLAVSTGYDSTYTGDVAQFLLTSISRPFTFDIPLDSNDQTDVKALKVRISPLEMLLGPDPTVNPDMAQYAVIREPGVDRDVVISLAIAAAFCGSPYGPTSDKAKSWVVEVLTPLATHPAVTRLAIRGINQAVIDAKLDARRLGPQYKEAVVRAYFGTLLGLLERMGKVDPEITKIILEHLPVNSLTVKAALSLATIPTKIDASDLV